MFCLRCLATPVPRQERLFTRDRRECRSLVLCGDGTPSKKGVIDIFCLYCLRRPMILLFFVVSGGCLSFNSERKARKNASRNRWFLHFLCRVQELLHKSCRSRELAFFYSRCRWIGWLKEFTVLLWGRIATGASHSRNDTPRRRRLYWPPEANKKLLLGKVSCRRHGPYKRKAPVGTKKKTCKEGTDSHDQSADWSRYDGLYL